MSEPVLVRREGATGRLTLNRPAVLNVLDLPMIRALATALDTWEHDDTVAAVLLDGAGTRGLCAGGDVRFLYDDVARGGHEFATLLVEEYRLDARIAGYPKPYVALMDGVVMGGGVGVSAHGSVRVVTERTVLAMPEVSIGYVPDVGGTWLLARAPGELGTHIALSGARLSAADAIACGLADVCVPSQRLAELTTALTTAPPPPPQPAPPTLVTTAPAPSPHDEWDSRRDLSDESPTRQHPAGGSGGVADVVRRFAVDAGASGLVADRGWIDACYRADSVAGIVDRLCDAGHAHTADAITANSPIALVMTLRALRTARGCTLADALAQEYQLARACARWPDFTEGVRAKLIDRDEPRWQPATLTGVTDEVIDEFLRGARPDDPPLVVTRGSQVQP